MSARPIRSTCPGPKAILACWPDTRRSGGVAEFSQSTLNILAETARPIGEFDVADLKARIEDMERNVLKQPVGDELDREIQLLDQYRTLHQYITVTTAL